MHFTWQQSVTCHFDFLGLDMVIEIQKLCKECAQMDSKDSCEALQSRIIGTSPSTTLYTLEVCATCGRLSVVHAPLLFYFHFTDITFNAYAST